MQSVSSSYKGPLRHLTVSFFLHIKQCFVFSVQLKGRCRFHFTGFNTYDDDVQNELFVATNIFGEMNTESSIQCTVYEENLRIYSFSKLKRC